MKKLLLLTITVFTFGFTMNAQTTYGAKAGVIFTNVTGDDVTGAEMKTGITGGAFVNVGISEAFSVQPELLFVGKGAGFEGSDDNVNYNYIEIPLMAQYSFGGLYLEAGPSFGFLMSAKWGDIDLKDGLKTFDLGVGLGAGYKMENGLNINARFTPGLTNITDTEGASSTKNSVIALTLGYSFGG